MRIVPEKNRRVKVGQQLGRITILGEPFYIKRGAKLDVTVQMVVGQCECGTVNTWVPDVLLRGDVKGCGCRRGVSGHEMALLGKHHNKKHGGRNTRLYGIWHGMKGRCFNPKDAAFDRYGGRGVVVCREWAEDFAAFREWAISAGYTDELSIERKNSWGNYEPGNCEWITKSENTARANRSRKGIPLRTPRKKKEQSA